MEESQEPKKRRGRPAGVPNKPRDAAASAGDNIIIALGSLAFRQADESTLMLINLRGKKLILKAKTDGERKMLAAINAALNTIPEKSEYTPDPDEWF